jgi:hypothetical protein
MYPLFVLPGTSRRELFRSMKRILQVFVRSICKPPVYYRSTHVYSAGSIISVKPAGLLHICEASWASTYLRCRTSLEGAWIPGFSPLPRNHRLVSGKGLLECFQPPLSPHTLSPARVVLFFFSRERPHSTAYGWDSIVAFRKRSFFVLGKYSLRRTENGGILSTQRKVCTTYTYTYVAVLVPLPRLQLVFALRTYLVKGCCLTRLTIGTIHLPCCSVRSF